MTEGDELGDLPGNSVDDQDGDSDGVSFGSCVVIKVGMALGKVHKLTGGNTL